MFGYGGPVATMCLGKYENCPFIYNHKIGASVVTSLLFLQLSCRRAIVSSKTKTCNKVFTLHLEREALVSASHSENCWRTTGGIRDSTEAEKDKSPHGSFTKVHFLRNS
ncbi:hypothetical protein ACS0TY_034229 [Phlomoides rotata]